MHPAISHVLSFFASDHPPAHLQDVYRPFAELAKQVANRAPESQETTVALRKLLEARDAAVRAALPPPKPPPMEVEVVAAASRSHYGGM